MDEDAQGKRLPCAKCRECERIWRYGLRPFWASQPNPLQNTLSGRQRAICILVNNMIQLEYIMSKSALTERQQQAIRFLRNAIVHDGHSPSVRDLAKALGYKSPRTAFLVIHSLIATGWLKRSSDGQLQLIKDFRETEDNARTVNVPLIGSVACGQPLLAEENIEAFIPVSMNLAKPGNRYFLLRANGDSMNEAGIENGDLVLVRQQSHAENGNKVVALIDDEATVKEFWREKETVILKPRSRNNAHKPIVVSENFMIQGVVVTAIKNFN